MSSKVSVLEGQLARNFGGVKLLRTDLANGGSCEWIPESDVQLTTLNINKNGTYKAKDYADKKGNIYYGFSQVTVNVTGRTTIVDPEDGNEYSVEVDEKDPDGRLKKTVLPSSISVVGLPTKTTYREGDPINKSGMVVKAYLADGTLYDYEYYQFGGIPLSELEIEPTKASSAGMGYQTATSDLVDGEVMFGVPPSRYYTGPNTPAGAVIEGGTAAIFNRRMNYSDMLYQVVASSHPFMAKLYEVWSNGTEHNITEREAGVYTYNNKDVYYVSIIMLYRDNYIFGQPLNNIEGAAGDKLAWTVIYGDIKGVGSQQITLKWNRPEDGKELTDTFEINVIPANTSGESGEGNTGESNETGGGGGSW